MSPPPDNRKPPANARPQQPPPAKEPPSHADQLRQLVTKRMVPTVAKLLAKGQDADRFARMFLTALQAGHEDLALCTEWSVGRAMLHCAELDLMPGGAYPFAYLIPYKDNARGVIECQFQISVWGFTELVRRAGVRKVWADVIYEGDVYDCVSGTAGKSIIHKPQWFASRKDRGALLGSYACALLENGETVCEPVSAEDLEMARAQNAGKSPAWVKWPEQQYQKVAIKRMSKYLPKGDARSSRAMEIDDDPRTAPIIDVSGLDLTPDNQSPAAQPATPKSALDDAVAQATAQAVGQNMNGKPSERAAIDRDRLFGMLCDADERWMKLRARVDAWTEGQSLEAAAYLHALSRDIGPNGHPPDMPSQLNLDAVEDVIR